jgi:S1-C subfamily serine protease
LWQGTLLQAPHPAVSAQQGVEPGGVYVSWYWFGSPANRSGLRATQRIVEFDGVPIPDLDAFLAIAVDLPNGRAVRLKTLDLDGKVSVVTLKLDSRFWPTREIRRGPGGWERIDHETAAGEPGRS